jgi:hypothetical protein
VTTKARRRERYAQDPDYRANQRARCRAYYRAHKQEINERSRAYYHAHKQDIQPILRRGQLKRLYGMSPADYDGLLAKQDGVCAICGKPSEETLCVDHCHATGIIRGLLCRKCNTGLGCYEDDPATMITSLAYLGGARVTAPAPRARALAAAPCCRRARGHDGPGGARSRDRLDSDPTPAGDSAMRPMRRARCPAPARSDDGEGGKAKILQLIARKLAPGRSPATSRRSRKSSTAWMDHRSRPRLRTSRREVMLKWRAR